MADSITISSGDNIGFLMVCLCDVTADDLKSALSWPLRGTEVEICEKHSGAVKLQALVKLSPCAVVFAHYEPNGDFNPKTLAEIIDAAKQSPVQMTG